MADILVAHLMKKSGEHGALKTLASQWDFDEKLIPKALQAVGNLFSHYSRHDESHSRQILINIERLLGESLSLLTATDTWLILEAAYWHDIGMVVPKSDLSDELRTEEFSDFLALLRQSPQHELHRFASSFDPLHIQNCFLGADNPMDAMSRFNELMAEWFRRKHPARAEKIVNEPWSSVGISSPRTELMPARLFRVLGKICLMHGSPFEALLSVNGLPFKEAGMANEDCHPRFVACLLRMGDLLDLDDNRFCPVLQRIAGDHRPSISKAHEDKHQAIRHLRIDRDRIEVSAECHTIPGYLEAFRWFDWLKQETQSQMAHWQEIAPSRELGLLPTLGNLTVTLSGDLQVLREGERPQFGIDEKSVVGLLQGSNLYNSPFPCVRELLQNAVDATLLSVWVKESPHAGSNDWNSPAACARVQNATPVEVELVESDDPPDAEGKSKWTLRITDGGTGISSDDLLHMLRIGGSQKNVKRQRLIRSMPEWMKPSGAFGIGFQSAFLLSDCIRINTKSIFSNETLELEMHSPLGPNEGLVLVRRMNNDVAQSYGTKIEISFNLDRFAKRWKVSGLGGKRRLSLAAQLVTSMDPLFDDSFPYDAAEIVDEIMGFGENSLVGVKCNFSPAAKENVLLSSSPEPDDQWRFLTNAQDNYVGIRYWSASDRLAGRNSRYLYRGQPFKCESIYLPHVAFEINLLSGGAGVWLSANRDQLTPRAGGELRAVVLSALTQAVELDIKARTTGRVDGSHFPADFSLFVNAMALSEGGAWEGFAAQCSDAWKDVPLIRSSIRSCFDRPLWTFGPRADVDSRQIEHCDVCSASDNGDTLVNLAMRAWAKEKGGSVQVMSMDDFRQTDRESEELSGERIDVEHDRMVRRVGGPVFRFSLDPQPRYSEAAFSDHLIKVTSSFHNCRYLVPIEDERWRMLALREGFKINARWLIQNYENASSIMLLPYLFCDGQAQSSAAQLDKLCLIMQPVLANKLSVGEIRETYEALISYIDGDLMAKSHHAQDWMVARSA